MDLEGRLLGNRYEILENIGNGGMATVYRARCHVLNRDVAVKVLREEFTTDEEFVKRFNTEAQAAASLTHPNIVSVFDVGSEGDLHYIVMELIKGKTLKDIINEDGALSWKWSVNVAIQIASALETAHKNNIIHRDIKPHNIIITEDGIAKVTDFGIAKAVSNSTITAFGSTMGSVHYFSPEHARGGFTDAKSDLYSLGVVLYEMVTGKVPFTADTPVSVALKHMQETPKEPIEVTPGLPKSINDIIMKAMQKDISLRYQTATEMLRDLSRAIKNPSGDFVVLENQEKNFEATQRISTIYDKSSEFKERGRRTKKEDRIEEKGFRAFVNKHKVICAILGIVLLFTTVFILTSVIFNKMEKKDVQIPNLVGMEQTQAEALLKELKLIYEVEDEVYNKDVLSGCIISQNPTFIENYKIKEGSTIKVILSKGKNIVTVPKLIGLLKDDAVSQLEELDLYIEIEEVYDNKVEEGYVIEQSIKQNEQIDAGETITIKVSKGIEKVEVPNLVGKSEDEAKKAITEAGLKLKTVVTTEDTSKDDGTVLKQSLEPAEEVAKDSLITITVNVLQKQKEGTINVNVKSLYGEENIAYEDEEKTKVKKVELKIMVSGDTVYKEKVDPRVESISQKISGKGTVEVKIYINEILKGNKQINLNSTTEYTFE